MGNELTQRVVDAAVKMTDLLLVPDSCEQLPTQVQECCEELIKAVDAYKAGGDK